MSDDDPFNVDVPELLGSDFACVCSEAVRRAVLGGDLYMLVLFGEHDGDKVKIDGCDDDI